MNSVSSFFDPVQRQFSAVFEEKFWTKGKVITAAAVIGALGAYMAYRLGGSFGVSMFNRVPSVPLFTEIPINPEVAKNIVSEAVKVENLVIGGSGFVEASRESFPLVHNLFGSGTCPALENTNPSLCEGFFNAVPCVPDSLKLTQNLAQKTLGNSSAVQNLLLTNTSSAAAQTFSQITPILGVPPTLRMFSHDYSMINTPPTSTITLVGNLGALQPDGQSLEEGLEMAGTLAKKSVEVGSGAALGTLKMAGTVVKTSLSWAGHTFDFFLLKNQQLTMFGGAMAYGTRIIYLMAKQAGMFR